MDDLQQAYQTVKTLYHKKDSTQEDILESAIDPEILLKVLYSASNDGVQALQSYLGSPESEWEYFTAFSQLMGQVGALRLRLHLEHSPKKNEAQLELFRAVFDHTELFEKLFATGVYVGIGFAVQRNMTKIVE
jgi:hypothetical protein